MGDQHQPKLFGYWVSPFSVRVEIALKLKGIQYEYFEEDLAKKSPLLLQYNPVYKKVPVLVHNGKPIVDSLVILEYIDQTWKGKYPILPEDPSEKAIARFWAKFVHEKCSPALFKTIWSLGEQYEKDKAEARELLKVLEDEIQGKKFFGGDRIGLVDIVANFIAFLYRVVQEAIGLDVFTKDEFPNLWRWAEDFVNHGDISQNLPPREKLIANFPPPYLGQHLVDFFHSRLASSASDGN
ncbi:OLC1v1034961C1 [Oldenlandia corymbosa var. corymbosa]|uniref:Probable glutathione S-transferase n=1 Tax=Oldenlandia corymbosa var. corymbosa TaxID=529605 RepID=A0AAV1CUG8_OLDCO|nr:OLC1v1034961C1 [Oldenlandia corymbosa var. corymbosa]